MYTTRVDVFTGLQVKTLLKEQRKITVSKRNARKTLERTEKELTNAFESLTRRLKRSLHVAESARARSHY